MDTQPFAVGPPCEYRTFPAWRAVIGGIVIDPPGFDFHAALREEWAYFGAPSGSFLNPEDCRQALAAAIRRLLKAGEWAASGYR